MSRALCLLAVVLFVAACQPVPQVMERDKASALLALPDTVGVKIGRIGGAPPQLEDRLRRGLEGALQRHGLPASRQRGNLLSYRLAGRTVLDATPDGIAPVSFDWELRAWDDTIAARFTQEVEDGRADAVPLLLEELAEGVARRIRAERRDDSASARLKVSVAPDAEADLPAPLLRALETVLASQGLNVVPPAAPSHLHVFGSAEVGKVHAGLREVRLAWVVKWSDGREVGRVDQANVVPAEWLAGEWTPLAAAAAEGAASGISELVFKAQTELGLSDAASGDSRR